MSIPSSNILDMAFGLISKTPFLWLSQAGRTLNGIGLYATTYNPPVTLYGSIQAVNRNVYHQLGLDLQKNYISIHVSSPLVDIGRGHSGDRIVWLGMEYQLISEVNWYSIDGWIKVMAVEIGAYVQPDKIFDFTFDETFA